MINAAAPAVIVTGVSTGIGATIARHLVNEGFRVFGSVRSAKDAKTLIDDLGEAFQPLVFDVRDAQAVNAAATQVREALQGVPLKAIINNAGFAAFGPMERLADETFEASIMVNLIGTRIVTNAFLPLLRHDDRLQTGQIINVSSLSGILNTPMNGAYCVAKHALESLSEIYRRELLPDGIDVVSIRSGPVQSEIWNKNKAEAVPYNHEPYDLMAHNARNVMAEAERNAIPAQDIADAVLQILSRPKNRVAYHFSRGAVTSRILAALPARWTDRLIAKALMKPI
ncbi:MAG: SDR family NAD(P)-dependent oxidoreductase [Roseobacter sp.]